MTILILDQARHSGWAIYDYENKKPIMYGALKSESGDYADIIYNTVSFTDKMIKENNIDAVFIEDIQFQHGNVLSFKHLAWLQGALISYFVSHNTLYDLCPPSRWQGFCKASGRTVGEQKKYKTKEEMRGVRRTKEISILFVERELGIKTDNDNIADALCMGWYVVNNVKLIKE